MTQQRSSTGKATGNKKRKSSTKKGAPPVRISHIVKPWNMTLEEWQRVLRRQMAEREPLGVIPVDEKLCPGEYKVANHAKKQEYKVVYRGAGSPWNFCSCMDFKTSQLGTCKHIESVRRVLEQEHRRPHVFAPTYTSVYLSYRNGRQVSIRIGSDHRKQFQTLAHDYFDADGHLMENAYARFDLFLSEAARIDPNFRCYPDAMDFVVAHREAIRRQRVIRDNYLDESLNGLLRNATLYPYQKEGVLFAARAGHAIIADEMGLGKTIQAIGTAELLRREGFVENVLIICPTSLKYQWKREIERFTGSEVLVVEGAHTKRCEQYEMPQPYKIVSYNSISNDLKVLEQMEVDMVIMDEVQRLKNWDTQIARSARRIKASYSVLLSGTPLENKLEELYSIVELADQFCLGPYYLFRDKHIIVNENGKVVGYKNLNEIGETLKSVMIRRRKRVVALQLPGRIDQNLLVPMTPQQWEMHDEFKGQVARLVLKWQRMHFLSESDRKKLMLFLSKMRMVCDSSFILDQKTRYDTKIDELMNILDNILLSGEEKVVIFSGWERMTRLVAYELKARNIQFEYLHGGIPSPKRKDLVNNFTDIPDCRVFLSTDAGSTGLNLQAASVVINLDLPWNPAVLEQRIARIYRIGQQRNIQVINLVSAKSFEEEMIGRLKFKSSLFEGALDGGEDTVFANDEKFQGIMSMVADFVEEETESGTVAETPEQPAIETETTLDAFDDPVFEEDFVITVSDDDLPTSHADSIVASSGQKPDSTSSSGSSQTLATKARGEGGTAPTDLISQGVSFLSGLVQALSNSESTEQLVNTLVKEDPDTGNASVNIPVPDKQSVRQLFTMIGQLIKKM